MIYLDNASTTQVYQSAIDAMNEIYATEYFNPSSTYGKGIEVKRKIEDARQCLAKRFSCNANEIYFTSCATEANNWAINCGFKNKGSGNIVISAGEHACVYECAKNLKSMGLDVRIATLNSDGTVNVDNLLSLVDAKTCLVSVIHVSNETGAINDLAQISKAVKRKNSKTLFHSDGVQAFLKTNNNVKALGVDMYSISGHKVGAPKGIGALYVSSKISIKPFLFGGGQEKGMRSGTENVAGIVALAKATEEFLATNSNAKEKYDCALCELSKIENVTILSTSAQKSEYVLTFSAHATKAEIVQTMCSADGVLIGRGSACSSKKSGNRVLSEMQIPQNVVDGALRISFSPQTSIEEIKQGIKIISKNIEKLRGNKIG